MKRLILGLLIVGSGPLFSAENNVPPLVLTAEHRRAPRIVYRNSRRIIVVMPEDNNEVYADVEAVVHPELNKMNIVLKMYINNVQVGETKSELNW